MPRQPGSRLRRCPARIALEQAPGQTLITLAAVKIEASCCIQRKRGRQDSDKNVTFTALPVITVSSILLAAGRFFPGAWHLHPVLNLLVTTRPCLNLLPERKACFSKGRSLF